MKKVLAGKSLAGAAPANVLPGFDRLLMFPDAHGPCVQ